MRHYTKAVLIHMGTGAQGLVYKPPRHGRVTVSIMGQCRADADRSVALDDLDERSRMEMADTPVRSDLGKTKWTSC